MLSEQNSSLSLATSAPTLLRTLEPSSRFDDRAVSVPLAARLASAFDLLEEYSSKEQAPTNTHASSFQSSTSGRIANNGSEGELSFYKNFKLKFGTRQNEESNIIFRFRFIMIHDKKQKIVYGYSLYL